MSCKELVELATEYLEETMPAADRARLERHLENCPGCVNYLEQMEHTLSILGHIPEEEISTEAQAELLGVFRKWKNES
jgi:predicted anti-sigma-YlaC factor YlaD